MVITVLLKPFETEIIIVAEEQEDEPEEEKPEEEVVLQVLEKKELVDKNRAAFDAIFKLY